MKVIHIVARSEKGYARFCGEENLLEEVAVPYLKRRNFEIKTFESQEEADRWYAEDRARHPELKEA